VAQYFDQTSSVLSLQATTGLAGYTMVNATGTILTWAVPNDGKMHRFFLILYLKVTSAQTGGAIGIAFTDPSNTAQNFGINGGGNNAGTDGWGNGFTNWFAIPLYPGSTFSLQQTSAQSAGAATLWAELWAS
jgi:hypothetical protein